MARCTLLICIVLLASCNGGSNLKTRLIGETWDVSKIYDDNKRSMLENYLQAIKFSQDSMYLEYKILDKIQSSGLAYKVTGSKSFDILSDGDTSKVDVLKITGSELNLRIHDLKTNTTQELYLTR